MLSPDRRARHPGAHLVEPRCDADRVPRPRGAGGARQVRRPRPGGRRHRHGPGVPSLHPAARVARRPADRDPVGPARLRVAVRTPGDGDVAPRDCGRPGDAPGGGRGRRTGGDPRALAGRQRPRRQPPAVPGRRRWRAPHHGHVLRRGAVGRGLVRARLDRRRRPVRARAGGAAARRRARHRRRPDARHRDRRRAVRPPPVVPRPVPPAPRRTRGGGRPLVRRRRLPGGDGRGGGSSPPRGPDPRPHLVELPPRRPALDRRVPGRPRRALEGARCGRRWNGSPAASTA